LSTAIVVQANGNLLQLFPDMSVRALVQRMYPWAADSLAVEGDAQHQETSRMVLSRMGEEALVSENGDGGYRLCGFKPESWTGDAAGGEATDAMAAAAAAAGGGLGPGARVVAQFERSAAGGGGVVEVEVAAGARPPQSGPLPGFVETEEHGALLSGLLQDHAAGRDVCIIGAKGSGKSAAARLTAHRLGYSTELFTLYRDMTARDLLQRRATDAEGNTFWEDSPLVRAARLGRLAVLDGIDRLQPDTLSALQGLLQDRRAELFDGSRLLPQDQVRHLNLAALEGGEGGGGLGGGPGASPVHPSFRVVALALPPTRTNRWLGAETVGLFGFHHLPGLRPDAHAAVLKQLYPAAANAAALDALVQVSASLERAVEAQSLPPGAEGASLSLSTRHLVRLGRLVNKQEGFGMGGSDPEASVRGERELAAMVHNTLLTQFMPADVRGAVDGLLVDAGIGQGTPTAAAAAAVRAAAPALTARVEGGDAAGGGVLHIGDERAAVGVPERPELVRLASPLLAFLPFSAATVTVAKAIACRERTAAPVVAEVTRSCGSDSSGASSPQQNCRIADD
jgi:hypothetical protein